MGEPPVAIGVIVNPRAGMGRGLRMLPRLAVTLRAIAEPSELLVTAERGEAIAVARRLAEAGARLVVAVGGDGTVNEVANGLLTANRPGVALGVVSAGRGIDFAQTLGIASDPEAALLDACRGQIVFLDAVEVSFAGNRRWLINGGGLGLDAAVAARADTARFPGRQTSYWAALAAVAPRYRPFPVELEVDGERISMRALTVVVANGPSFGGGFQIVPEARLDDGAFDLALVGAVSALDLIRYLPRLARGGHLDHPKVRHLPARSARVTLTGDEVREMQIDGELVALGGREVTFTVRPGALQLSR